MNNTKEKDQPKMFNTKEKDQPKMFNTNEADKPVGEGKGKSSVFTNIEGEVKDEPKNFVINNKKVTQYRIKYQQYLDKNVIEQQGGSELIWSNKNASDKYNSLIGKIGSPTYISKDSEGNVENVRWQLPLETITQNDLGHYSGLDMIKISNYAPQKFHPKPASVFVIVGKYIRVPDNLLGPLKYASETINIEQLFVPKFSNDNYLKSKGTKSLALVTGSCGSVTISVITIKFVEDMITQHGASNSDTRTLDNTFRQEYDRRIENYLCNRGIDPSIDWFDHAHFGEPATMNINC